MSLSSASDEYYLDSNYSDSDIATSTEHVLTGITSRFYEKTLATVTYLVLRKPTLA